MGNSQNASGKKMSGHKKASNKTANKKIAHKKRVLDIKTTSITNDFYLLSENEIGKGTSCRKVIICMSKKNGKKYALKVCKIKNCLLNLICP